MPRFHVYKNPEGDGYLLDLQANLLSLLNTRVVVPLMPVAGVNYLVRPATTILAGGGGEFVDGLGVFGCLFLSSFLNGCSASEARQAGGICRGAVVKPRTPQGLSTGLACGQVACPRRAKFVQTLSIVVAARARFAGACAA